MSLNVYESSTGECYNCGDSAMYGANCDNNNCVSFENVAMFNNCK